MNLKLDIWVREYHNGIYPVFSFAGLLQKSVQGKGMPHTLLYGIIELHPFPTNNLDPFFVFSISVYCPLAVLSFYGINPFWAYNYMVDLRAEHSYIVKYVKNLSRVWPWYLSFNKVIPVPSQQLFFGEYGIVFQS